MEGSVEGVVLIEPLKLDLMMMRSLDLIKGTSYDSFFIKDDWDWGQALEQIS